AVVDLDIVNEPQRHDVEADLRIDHLTKSIVNGLGRRELRISHSSNLGSICGANSRMRRFAARPPGFGRAYARLGTRLASSPRTAMAIQPPKVTITDVALQVLRDTLR